MSEPDLGEPPEWTRTPSGQLEPKRSRRWTQVPSARRLAIPPPVSGECDAPDCAAPAVRRLGGSRYCKFDYLTQLEAARGGTT
jgi:hypothetical protein